MKLHIRLSAALVCAAMGISVSAFADEPSADGANPPEPSPAQALITQKVSEKSDRQVDHVEGRVNDKVDEKTDAVVDKALDHVLDKLFH